MREIFAYKLRYKTYLKPFDFLQNTRKLTLKTKIGINSQLEIYFKIFKI